MHTYGTSTAISCYLAIIAAISLISAALLKDRSQEDYISVAPRAPDPDAGQPLVASSAKPTLS